MFVYEFKFTRVYQHLIQHMKDRAAGNQRNVFAVAHNSQFPLRNNSFPKGRINVFDNRARKSATTYSFNSKSNYIIKYSTNCHFWFIMGP